MYMYVCIYSLYIERHGFAYIAQVSLSLTVCPGWLGTCDPPVWPLYFNLDDRREPLFGQQGTS